MTWKALDLFCGGGGAALGLMEAGFDVTGIDIKPQKHYPGLFIQADVLHLPVRLHDFDFIWASPPCQAYSVASKSQADFNERNYPALIPDVRELLRGHPYTCIENVPGAPLKKCVILSGPSMGLNRIDRRRIFETSFFMLFPEPQRLPRAIWDTGKGGTITTSMASRSHFYPRKRAGLPGRIPLWEAKEMMGIPQDHKMTVRQVGEAVPPKYSEFIGREVLRRLKQHESEYEETDCLSINHALQQRGDCGSQAATN